jgi:phosphoglycerate dehydrogenase-like enzyme
MIRHKALLTTERGYRHQQSALRAAPDELDLMVLRQPDRETLRRHLADVEYWISERTGAIDADLIGAAPQLKMILRLGSLWHDIDIQACEAAGIAVCHWSVAGAIRVAEHVVMQMLALVKKLRETQAVVLEASACWGPSRRTDEDTFAYNWSGRRDVDGLWRKTVGILGFGEIGAELARRLQGWGCTLLYHKRRRLPAALETGLGIAYAGTVELASESDFLVNLLPYSAQTDGWLDAAYLANLKRGAFVVSCGSGSVIDETALSEAVRSGALAGAALDTYEWEPIRAEDPLLALAREGYNVLLTPHVAAGATAADAERRRDDYSNILRHLEGRPLLYRIV